jgi:hypothetical protein
VNHATGARAARWIAPAILLAARAASGGAAAPGAEGRFVLDTSGCPGVSEPEIRRIVAIEIGDMLIDPLTQPLSPLSRGEGSSISPGAERPAADRLIIRCDGDVAAVEAMGAGGAVRVVRSITLRDFPGDAAPRVLALAGLEALAAQSPAVRERIEARRAPPAPSEPARPAPAPPAAPSANRVGLAFVWRTFAADDGLSAWGGRVDWARDLGARWDVTVDLEAGSAGRTTALGETSALLVSVGAFAGLRAGGPALLATFGVGGRVGGARLAGDPMGSAGVQGATVVRPWLGPALAARLRARLGPIGAALFAEAGFAARGAEGLAGGETVIALDGPWVMGGAGLWF